LIRQAFDSSVGVLGERSKQLLIEDLKYHDVYLNDPDLNLQKLMKALKAILREEPAEMIIERIMIKLDELEDNKSK
jgi:hypothetical protein